MNRPFLTTPIVFNSYAYVRLSSPAFSTTASDKPSKWLACITAAMERMPQMKWAVSIATGVMRRSRRFAVASTCLCSAIWGQVCLSAVLESFRVSSLERRFIKM